MPHRESRTPRQILDLAMTEAELQDAVIALAERRHWRCYHVWDSRLTTSAGFPDWVLVRDRVLFVELKRQRGVASIEQAGWFGSLRRAGADVRIWRPSDWSSGEIEETLR